MLIILSRWFVLHYAGECPGQIERAFMCTETQQAYEKKKHIHAWVGTCIPHTYTVSRAIHTRKVIFLYPPLHTLQNKLLKYTHLHSSTYVCIGNATFIWSQQAVYPAAETSINKCSIINKPQNGSNCSLHPNASINVPRTFQPELFLITASSQGKKTLICRIFHALLGFRGQCKKK